MSEKKGEFDVTPWIIGLGCLAGGISLGWILPDILKLLNPQPKENPNPKPESNPQNEQEPEESSPELWVPQPHFTRDIPKQLTARFTHSSTTTDSQSLVQKLRNQQALERADLHSRQQQARWKPKQIRLAPPQDQRLTYGSDGHGSHVSVKRPQKRKWRLKK